MGCFQAQEPSKEDREANDRHEKESRTQKVFHAEDSHQSQTQSLHQAQVSQEESFTQAKSGPQVSQEVPSLSQEGEEGFPEEEGHSHEEVPEKGEEAHAQENRHEKGHPQAPDPEKVAQEEGRQEDDFEEDRRQEEEAREDCVEGVPPSRPEDLQAQRASQLEQSSAQCSQHPWSQRLCGCQERDASLRRDHEDLPSVQGLELWDPTHSSLGTQDLRKSGPHAKLLFRSNRCL